MEEAATDPTTTPRTAEQAAEVGRRLDELDRELTELEDSLGSARAHLETAVAGQELADKILGRLVARVSEEHRLSYEFQGLFKACGACTCGWRGARHIAPIGWPAMDAEHRDHLRSIGL